jgi:heme-binding protein
MVFSGRTIRCAVAGLLGSGAIAGAFIAGAWSAAADPTPGCTAGDLAQVSAGVASATADYLFSHPDVNNFFTSLHGQPDNEIRGDVQTYMDANPQVKSDLTGIRQPLTDLKARCQ